MPRNSTSGASHSTPAETIQAVTAVPTLAPSSTICAMRDSTMRFSTKEAVSSAVAVELCRAMVAMKPDRKEREALCVPLASPERSLAPKASVTPSLTCRNPNSSRATAPKRLIITTVDATPAPSSSVARQRICTSRVARKAYQLTPIQEDALVIYDNWMTGFATDPPRLLESKRDRAHRRSGDIVCSPRILSFKVERIWASIRTHGALVPVLVLCNRDVSELQAALHVDHDAR